MSSTVLTPATVGAATGWSNVNNALLQDNVVATLAAGAGASAWLPVRLSTASIDLDDELVGYILDIWAGVSTTASLPLLGENSNVRLEIAISTDGVTPLGSAKSVEVYQQVSLETAGAEGDDWDTSLTPALVNAGLYLLVRRPSAAGEDDIVVRLLDYLRLTAYHNPGGGSLVAERMTSLQRAQIGKETTRGTAVAATHRVMDVNITPNPQGTMKTWTPQGDKLATEHILMNEWASASFAGIPCYRGLGRWLASGLEKPVTSGGSGVFEHEFRYKTRSQSDFQTYTLEWGEAASRAEEYAYAFVNDFDMMFERGAAEASLNGGILMQRITDGITVTPGTTEQQTITLSGASSGTFILVYKGARTSALAYNITTGAMQTALQALSTGADLTVGGSAGAWVVSFPSGENEPFIEVFSNGTNGTFAITETTRGGLVELGRMPIIPGQLAVYVADTVAGLAAGKITNAFANGFSAKNLREIVWTHNDTNASFAEHSDNVAEMASLLTVKANSDGMAYLTNIRANTLKYVRLRFTGPLISGSDYFGFDIDMAVKFSELPPIENKHGLVARQWTLAPGFDVVEGFSVRMKLKNDVSAY